LVNDEANNYGNARVRLYSKLLLQDGSNVDVVEALKELHRRQGELEVRALDLEARQGALCLATDDLNRQAYNAKMAETPLTVGHTQNLVHRLLDRKRIVTLSLSSTKRRTRRALAMLSTLKEKLEQLIDTMMAANTATVHRQMLDSIRPLMQNGGVLDPSTLDALRDEADEQSELLDEATETLAGGGGGLHEEEDEEEEEDERALVVALALPKVPSAVRSPESAVSGSEVPVATA
jgi:hypothetical protein